MFPLKILSALVALLLVAPARAETNVTIDDTDPRIVYEPAGVWTFEGNTALTQDRLNKTTHFTSELGATASLTFTGTLYVYYIGYGIKEMPPPALVPTTLQPEHGSAITVESDSYRPAGAQAQITLFTSTKLDPTETYTITVTKTNATLVNGVNIDAFILTQPDAADSITSSLAPTTFASGAIGTASGSSAQSSSTANTNSSQSPANTGVIAGGVIGGIAVGIVIAFLSFHWWLKWNQQKRAPDGLPIPLHDGTPRPAYFDRTPSYQSKGAGTPPRATMPRETGHHSPPSTLVSEPHHLAPPSIAPGRQSPVGGRTEMAQARQGLAYTPLVQGKAQYMGDSQPNSVVSASSSPSHVMQPSSGDTGREEPMLPAYSRH